MRALTQEQDKVVVDFCGDWCHYSTIMNPHFAALSHEFKRVVFCTVDVAQGEQPPCGVQAVPTFHFIQVSASKCVCACMAGWLRRSLQSCQKVGELIGAKQESELRVSVVMGVSRPCAV